MGTLRKNTLIIDFNVLPKRPDAAEVEKFCDEEIQLQLSDTTNIQLHNVRNCVYVEMVDAETALRYQNEHNNRHTVHCDGKQFKIPVYVEKETVTVRVHDLPPLMPHTAVLDFMEQYGTAISITRERWKHYFPGVYNGVRVLQMKLDRPIPSFVTINGEITMVTYRNQPKTCRFCGLPIHPKQKCAKPSSTPSNNTSTPTEPENRPKPGRIDASTTAAASSSPALGTRELNNTTIAQQNNTDENNTENTINDDDGSSSTSEAFIEAVVNQKRRLARMKEKTTKKLCQQDSQDASTSIVSSNRFEALVELDWVSPTDLESIGKNSGKGGDKI